MLIRQHVRASATRVVPPQAYAVRVELWAMAPVIDRQTSTGSKVYISLRESECTYANGVPIPTEMPIRIDLNQGEEIWAISTDDSFMGISILSRGA